MLSQINKGLALLETINDILDWNEVDSLIREYYSKGKSAVGRESYPALVLFKMVLLGYLSLLCWIHYCY